MADAVEHSLRYLNPADLKAIAVYLKSSPARTEGVIRPPLAVSVAPPQKGLGLKLFNDTCVACHLVDGGGRQSPAGSLAGLKTVNDPSGRNLIATLLEGHTPDAMRSDQRMPDFTGSYSDEELAAVSTFVLRRFGQTQGQIKPEDIANSRTRALH